MITMITTYQQRRGLPAKLYIDRLSLIEDRTQQIVQTRGVLARLGARIDLPENGMPHIIFPLHHLNVVYGPLVAFAIDIMYGLVRDCVGFKCQALKIHDIEYGDWTCTNPDCEYHHAPIDHNRIVAFDWHHKRNEQRILRGGDSRTWQIIEIEKSLDTLSRAGLDRVQEVIRLEKVRAA